MSRRRYGYDQPPKGIGKTHAAPERGWKKISQVQDRHTGDIAVVYMSTSETRFRCEIESQRFTAERIEEVNEWAATMLKHIQKIEWLHVIEVEVEATETWHREDRHEAGGLKVEITDFMVSTVPVGEDYLSAEVNNNPEFNTPEQFMKDARRWHWDIKKRGKFKVPTKVKKDRYDGSGVAVYLPYTQATWDGLLALIEQLKQLEKRLSEFLVMPDIVARLEAASTAFLLEAPKD